jgi:hypothetical protein
MSQPAATPARRIRRARRLAAAIRRLEPGGASAVTERIASLNAELNLPCPEGADPAEMLARIATTGARLPPEIPVALAALLMPILRPATRTADR